MSVSLISRWFIRPGHEFAALAAVDALAAAVQENEPDTLTYFVHTPYTADTRLQSLPPSDRHSLLFYEQYRTAGAFLHHVNGPVFTGFVKDHGHHFVNAHGGPFTFVEFLERRAGFTRSAPTPCANEHPGVMFEIIARDQPALEQFYNHVFHWKYQTGTGGFAYIHFPEKTLTLLGGIGQAQCKVPGFEPGHNFYLQVDDLDQTIHSALAAGATRLMDPTEVDGYHFAMIKDPEGNPIGLIKKGKP